jgi:hypothetical protein
MGSASGIENWKYSQLTKLKEEYFFELNLHLLRLPSLADCGACAALSRKSTFKVAKVNENSYHYCRSPVPAGTSTHSASNSHSG